MAKLSLPADLVGKIAPLLQKLPFVPKKSPPEGVDHEPFEDLEDASPDSDESFEPNVLGRDKGKQEGKSGFDFMALVHAILGNPVLLGVLGAVLLFLLVAAVASIMEQAPPAPPKTVAKPITDQGREDAKRFLLPPDPALDLSPPMEREPLLRYTDEDVRRMSPTHNPRDLELLVQKNDAAIRALLEAVP